MDPPRGGGGKPQLLLPATESQGDSLIVAKGAVVLPYIKKTTVPVKADNARDAKRISMQEVLIISASEVVCYWIEFSIGIAPSSLAERNGRGVDLFLISGENLSML